ncbi:aminotransferase class IV [Nocardioides jiangxiensis]|uniref:Aminotransferase class IV n=1 Tax=Nocardioides jiangxiensis TaxID=3064524 RepID=A0ABT9B022_9ACTN|nr:aminotransferase class IV [Nocardioides sp. WY-20]MDO7866957.1 aminotransferase class IV [Nocardioides sp. WY-20]
MQATANGVFTTVLVRDGEPHHLGLHLRRIDQSARIAGLPAPDWRTVDARVTAALVEAGATVRPSSRMRIRWDGDTLTVTAAPFAGHDATTSALRADEARDPTAPAAGAKTEALGDQGRRLLAWAHERGAGEALLATTGGFLAEGATSNVFYVIGGELRTPTASTGLLDGIARRLVLAATGGREVDAPYDVLRDADEVFLTSSLRGVQPVTSVDGREIGGPGPTTRAAQRAWQALPVGD